MVARRHHDLLLVALLAVATYVLASLLDLHELFTDWAAQHERWELDELSFSLVTLVAGMGWYVLRRKRELQDADARNRALAQQLIGAQEAERQALARELHDEMGQHCSAILAEAASWRRAADDERALAAAARVEMSAQSMALLLRDLLRRLRPAELDALGLLGALQALCESWEERSEVACVFHHEGMDQDLPDAHKVAVYRVVQESLTNVMRHAQATSVRVALSCGAGGLRVTVRDDGRGIDPSTPRRGLGLLGATERAAALGGTLRVDSRPGAGVRVTLELPHAAPSRQHREAA